MHQNLTFRKSSYSATRNDCVEVADQTHGAAIRDSQHPHTGLLTFPSAEWRAFVAAVRTEEL